MKRKNPARRYPIGAEVIGANETHFRVWAPKAKRVTVVFGKNKVALKSGKGGYFAGAAPCGAGARYKFRLDDGEAYPDPISRYQPDGPHGESCVIDPFTFKWSDANWRGVELPGQVIYEFHVGTFTQEGTWDAAAEKLEELTRDGITLLEMMPIADFGGNFGWGYDGVDLFAPTRLYGEPDDLRAFIDRAHALGLGVLLDVVYNHLGPDGNYLAAYTDDFISRNEKHENEWGDAINFDGPNSGPVREFFITNARYWIEEFHFDGFRFDATQSIHDSSAEYIVGAIGRAARKAAGVRKILLLAENEPQEPKLLRPLSEGGDELDGVWNDDWHHSALVALTGRNEAYLTDYRGSPQEFISAAKYGYLYQGQPYSWQEAPRGFAGLNISAEKFVTFIENHDQVSNFPSGDRVRNLTSPGRYRAITALLLLGPCTPLLFQGEEFGATTPFSYFADVGDEKLKEAVRKGRFDFLAQFPSAATAEAQAQLPDPAAEKTFTQSKLDWSEKEKNVALVNLHRDLISLRRTDSRLRKQGKGGIDGAVLSARAFLLRFFGNHNDDRLLVTNLGERHKLMPSEPLLAPPAAREWEMVWSSESVRYGGLGETRLLTDKEWILPAEATFLLRPQRRTRPRQKPKKR